jgi:putative hydrolase of the HAD superfamily
MIKSVLFDYGGVLTEGGTSGCIQRTFASIYGIDPSEIDADADLILRDRQGTILEQDYFDEMNRRHPSGPRADRRSYLAACDVFEKSVPVYRLAEQLRKHGIVTGILSNINEAVAEELRARGFYDGFDPIVLSCEEGMAKPEPGFYDLALQRLGCKPDEVAFVDDQDKCRPPAEALGMHFILARSPGQIVSDVVALIRAENNLTLQ